MWRIDECYPVGGAEPPSGSSTWNVVPRPSRLSTQMRPPCFSTMPLQMNSPRPIPEKCRLSTFEALRNRSETNGTSPGADAAR